MPIEVVELSRDNGDQGPGTFELRVQWKVTAPHMDGIIVQQVTRSEKVTKQQGAAKTTTTVYWEAWEVSGGAVHGRDILDPDKLLPLGKAAHDSFVNLTAAGDGETLETSFATKVWWMSRHSQEYDTLLGRLKPHSVPYAGPLLASTVDPIGQLAVEQVMERSETFVG